MIEFELYDENDVMIDKGETSIKNIGYITMPLAANNHKIVIKRYDAPRLTAA